MPRAVISGPPLTMLEARQLVSTKIVPTERSMPPGKHRQCLRHRHKRKQHALVRRGIDDVRAQADRLHVAVEREHDDEDRDRDQQSALAAKTMAPGLPRARGGPRRCLIPAFMRLLLAAMGRGRRRLRSLPGKIERAGDEVALVQIGALQGAHDRPS